MITDGPCCFLVPPPILAWWHVGRFQDLQLHPRRMPRTGGAVTWFLSRHGGTLVGSKIYGSIHGGCHRRAVPLPGSSWWRGGRPCRFHPSEGHRGPQMARAAFWFLMMARW